MPKKAKPAKKAASSKGSDMKKKASKGKKAK